MDTGNAQGDLPAIRLSAWQLRRAKQLIEAHLDEPLSIAWLARECSLSRSHFSCAFHGSTGMSPHQWLTRARLARARNLLLAGNSVAAVACACGFNDQAHFARVFSRWQGLAPSRWRSAQQLDA
ncbi:AraC family transcriptional regulator [Pseudomonas sp. GOM7]|uniref:helix-turn-helix domain-containing protein n=1 Tax=unclassified Pseudomonas TaxID=196821 RepID=UPI00227A4C04|nr:MULTISPECIES: AraC family transcriptional regulator [unclassified Pseudomonas]WAJ38926.1 AraC family transcriptional regulator [Pseudomonas sp. GOM7]